MAPAPTYPPPSAHARPPSAPNPAPHPAPPHQELSLTHNDITARGAVALASAIRTNRSVTSLDLHPNPFHQSADANADIALALRHSARFLIRELNGFAIDAPRSRLNASDETNGDVDVDAEPDADDGGGSLAGSIGTEGSDG